jgi:hypothetical protein
MMIDDSTVPTVTPDRVLSPLARLADDQRYFP